MSENAFVQHHKTRNYVFARSFPQSTVKKLRGNHTELWGKMTRCVLDCHLFRNDRMKLYFTCRITLFYKAKDYYMKNTNTIIVIMLFVSMLMLNVLVGQETITSGSLSITVTKLSKGVELSSIKKDNLELLDTKSAKTLFTFFVDKLFLTSLSGWDSVSIDNSGAECSIVLANPSNSKMPSSLRATVTIVTSNNKSDWDLSITGLLTSSLSKVGFPYLNIKADGDDYCLIPKYSGKLIRNPKKSSINYTLNYPRGWTATMQFVAYYNDSYGIYLGVHDPKATKKDFEIKKNTKEGIKFQSTIPVENRYLPGNDWEFPGIFRFELFEGDWYEAAMIYKKWASAEAEYWPKESKARNTRQKAIGNIGAWFMPWDGAFTGSRQSYYESLRNSLGGVPIGLHWYVWYNGKSFDQGYPYLLPEKSGMKSFTTDIQKNNDIFIVPYMNGRIFETSLSQYNSVGKPNAVKDADGSVHFDVAFAGREWATMCPAQEAYQDILVNQATQLINRVGTAGIYFDMVTAAGAIECFDTTHRHTLGGGNYWRSGYKKTFDMVHTFTADSKFITTEGACDYLADVVDGFLTLGWMTNNMVPAFQAVYSGKLQLFTVNAGYDYNSQVLYAKYVSSFINGIQPGHFSASLQDSPNSTEFKFLKRIANMRYKLKNYMSFGQLLKPISVDRSGIPDITTTWFDHGVGDVPVTISALQSSYWKNKEEDKVVVVFANASMSKTLDFTLNFDGNLNGVYGKVKIQKITADGEGAVSTEENSFTKNITLAPLDILAYVIEPDSIISGLNEESMKMNYKLEQNYPNPFNPSTIISFFLPKAGLTKLSVYNLLGQEIAVLTNKEMLSGSYEYEFDASRFSSGIYFYQLQSGTFVTIKKMLLIK